MTFHYTGFTSHQAVARTAGNVLLRLADSLLLPFNCSDYAESLEQYLRQAVTAFEEKLAAKGISMGELTRFSRLLWMREMLIKISEFCQTKCLCKVREMKEHTCQSGNENKHFFHIPESLKKSVQLFRDTATKLDRLIRDSELAKGT